MDQNILYLIIGILSSIIATLSISLLPKEYKTHKYLLGIFTVLLIFALYLSYVN